MKYKPGLFKDKKITLMGLGLLGRGLGDARFFAQEGAELIVTDLKTKEELASSIEALKDFPAITYVLGEHRLEDFKDRDMILKAAGVPLDSPYIAEARKNNISIEMSAALFAKLSPTTIIGITGTRGKSTTTHLIYEILKMAYGHEKTIFLGGNVKGVSTLEYLRRAKPGDIAVLELDSWQLQGFGEDKISPHISVFTTFLPDHLNYYKGDLAVYLEDKSQIFKYQKEDDMFILGSQAAPIVREKYESSIKSTIIEVTTDVLPATWKIPLPGLHNRYNAALAMRTAQLMGIGTQIIQDTIEHFRGVPGRLEFIREVNGVKIYNDTTATTPDATLAALRAFGPQHSVILIMGGADKNLDMGHLFMDIPAYAKGVVTIPGTGTDRMKPDLEKLERDNKDGEHALQVIAAASLEEAVKKAVSLAHAGDTVVLSPGFASFGLFKNEYERGDKFNEIVSKL